MYKDIMYLSPQLKILLFLIIWCTKKKIMNKKTRGSERRSKDSTLTKIYKNSTKIKGVLIFIFYFIIIT